MTDVQLDFVPTKIREFSGDEPVILLNLDEMPPNEELLRGKINESTYKSIKANGQQYPILIAQMTTGGLAIIDGEQRVKIQRRLGNEQIPSILHPDKLTDFEVALLRAQMNNARQENPVADIMAIRHILDLYPSSTAKAIAIYTAIPVGRVKSLLKQAKMPASLIDGVVEGTVSKDTLASLSKKPHSIVKKAERKFLKERQQFIVEKNEDTGGRVFKRISDDKVFAKAPPLLTSSDVSDLQRVSVANKVNQAPMNMKVDFQESVEGFAAVKSGKFICDLYDTADEVRLEMGQKRAYVIVKVRSI